MVDLLFAKKGPREEDQILDPGCGTGEFIDGVIRWCALHARPLPKIVGVESDPKHLPALSAKYRHRPAVQVEHRDFLTEDPREFQFVIGNPPYVPITKLTEHEKRSYRSVYRTASGRFDLYLLFFEQAMKNLAPGGRLVFVTPEKFLYVDSAGPLRNLLAESHVERILLADEQTFGDLVTYPTITVVGKSDPGHTVFTARNGWRAEVELPQGRSSWLPILYETVPSSSEQTLSDFCRRISCGVATGADGVFVLRQSDITEELRVFARPTVSGRELSPGKEGILSRSQMLVPYDESGRLMDEGNIGALGEYLNRRENRVRLDARTCVRRKPWYAFHETPILADILRPKILCKDICERPHFVADYSGEILPRHSVYYLVPNDPATIPELLDFLRSDEVTRWLERNCQRAAKGFLRLQSRVLQKIPVPSSRIGPTLKSVSLHHRTKGDNKIQLALPV